VETFPLYFLDDWPLTFADVVSFSFATENTPLIVVIGVRAILMTGHKQRYFLSRMLKDFDV
jgi:hypothetical protein